MYLTQSLHRSLQQNPGRPGRRSTAIASTRWPNQRIASHGSPVHFPLWACDKETAQAFSR